MDTFHQIHAQMTQKHDFIQGIFLDRDIRDLSGNLRALADCDARVCR